MVDIAPRPFPLDANLRRFRYDMSAIHRADKYEYCETAIHALYGPVTLEVLDRSSVFARAIGVRLGAGSIIFKHVSPIAVERTPADVARMEDESFSLLINVAGRSKSKWGNNDVRDRREGILTFQSNNQRFRSEVYSASGCKSLSIRYPKSALATLIGRAPPETAVMIGPQVHAAAIRSVTNLLMQRLSNGQPAEIEALYNASLALNAALVAGDPDFLPAVAGNLKGARAGLLDLLKRYIEVNLLSPHLSLSGAARHCGISVRYVQMLFEAERTTFKRYIQQRRLDRLYNELRDPSRRGISIADLAAPIGLQDRAAMHRAFKERFGLTPGLLRKFARGTGTGPTDPSASAP